MALAANEMKERVEKLLGDDAKHIMMGTFHAMCAILLRRHGMRIGLTTTFGITDASDRCADTAPAQLTVARAAEPEKNGPCRLVRTQQTDHFNAEQGPARGQVQGHRRGVTAQGPAARYATGAKQIVVVESSQWCPSAPAAYVRGLRTDNVLGRISHQKSIKRSPSQYRATLQPTDRTVRERVRPVVGPITARGANTAILQHGRSPCVYRAN